jgi:probable HAF family extracellular repeat protein
LAQQYTFTRGNFGPYTQVAAINASGQVVGEWRLGHAFIWNTRQGTMQDLGLLPGTDACKAFAINDSGQVVGWCRHQGAYQAFLWTVETGMTALSIPDSSRAMGINNQGHIVGSQGDPAHAFLYRDGTGEDLGPGHALGINDRDQVVGYGDGATAGTLVARLWDEAGPHDLDTEGGSTSAKAVSASGLVAGRSTRGEPYPGPFHAVLWTPDGVSDLGTFGGFYSQALAISGDLIVGTSQTASRANRAFLYDINGPGYPVDLQDLIRPSGCRLYSAEGINDAGQIAGSADCGGESFAFLLTPVQGSVHPGAAHGR